MGSYDPSPDYGRKLLPVAIDERAENDPSSVYCSLPYDDDDLSKGYEDITYQVFANAINQMAWFIHQKFGPSDNFDTFAYMGIPDMRYMIMQMAAAKTGYKVLFSSYTNSLSGHVNLMEKTDTKFMLSATGVKVDDILATRPMKNERVPELDDLLNASSAKPYPFNKTFDEAAMDPYLILHTSGSTGLPKPIVYVHGNGSAVHHHRSLPDVDDVSGLPRRFFLTHPGKPQRMLLPFLPFHGICGLVAMVGTVFGSLVYIPGFRHKAPTMNDIPNILDHCHAQSAFLSPSMIEDLARRPDIGEHLSKLDRVLYGGAPLTDMAGNIFAQHTHLGDQWGITETGKLMDLDPEPEDWAYCGFDTKNTGMEFVPITDDLYEMVIHRNSDSYPNVGYFWRCPDETTWHIGDLWKRHPDPKKSSYLWKFAGRTDDLITWKDGLNFHPGAYEGKHSSHDLIRSAVIAGTGHRQPVLLVELYDPVDNTTSQSAILDKIWEESIVPINKIAPKNGQISKTHVLFASADKPFERSVKGTVSRKATLKKYDAEIESVYDQFGDKGMDISERL